MWAEVAWTWQTGEPCASCLLGLPFQQTVARWGCRSTLPMQVVLQENPESQWKTINFKKKNTKKSKQAPQWLGGAL